MASPCFTPQELVRFNIQSLDDDQILGLLKSEMIKMDNSLRQAKMQLIILHRLKNTVMAHPKGPKAGLKAVIHADRTELANGLSLEAKMLAINARAHNMVQDMMRDFAPDLGGLRLNKKQQGDLIRVLFGESVENEKYLKFADDWLRLNEMLRRRFNLAGGKIESSAEWNIPLHHDPAFIKGAGFHRWYSEIIQELDLDAMGLALHRAPKVLKNFYGHVVSGGLEDFEPGKRIGSSKLANRHQDQRYLKFKTADGHLKYLDDYSNASPYTLMMDHVTMISNEIGLMETLGPNADYNFRAISKIVVQATNDPNAADSAHKSYANLSGKTHAHNRNVADTFQMLRNTTVGLKLPGAAVSALPDVIFNSMTARYNGLPGMRLLTTFAKQLNPANTADRIFAAKIWFPLEHLIDDAHSAMRFSEVGGHGTSARFAGSIMKMSGLAPWTVAGKRAFHMEFVRGLAEFTEGFDVKADGTYTSKGHKNMLRSLTRYGFTNRDIMNIKRIPTIEHHGVKYLDFQAGVSGNVTNIQERIIAMITSESKYAVPESDAYVKGIMNQGTRKGEIGGEIIRSGVMFKTFPVVIIANHWARAFNGHQSSLSYITQMLIGTWALGMVVVQLKEITKGNTPLDWNSPELARLGFQQGGSMSLVGDILSRDARSYGTTLQEYLLGPLASEGDKLIWRGMFGSLDALVEDFSRDTMEGLGRKAIGNAASYIPGQFWYSKQIMERVFLDEMRKFGDPMWELKEAKKEAKRSQELGNERWF